MKKRIKQGFTLVELVIVIAIIAILAAVLIPTFSNLITNAKNSADTQMVTNLNKYLASMEAIDGKNETMSEAMKDAKDAGYTSGSFLSASNIMLWDEETDRFMAIKGNKQIAGEDSAKYDKNKKEQYWIVSSDINDDYATYLVGNKEFSEGIKITLSLDLTEYKGKAPNITVSEDSKFVKLNGIIDTLIVELNSITWEYPETIVYGYVHKLDGSVTSKNATFHGSYDKYKLLSDESFNEINGSFSTDHYDGDKNGECDFCNDKIDPEHVHTLVVDGNETEPATCESIGITAYKCKDNTCDYSKFEVIEKLEHDYSINGYDQNEHWLSCSRCKSTINNYSHTIDYRKNDGNYTIYCTDCEYEVTSSYLLEVYKLAIEFNERLSEEEIQHNTMHDTLSYLSKKYGSSIKDVTEKIFNAENALGQSGSGLKIVWDQTIDRFAVVGEVITGEAVSSIKVFYTPTDKNGLSRMISSTSAYPLWHVYDEKNYFSIVESLGYKNVNGPYSVYWASTNCPQYMKENIVHTFCVGFDMGLWNPTDEENGAFFITETGGQTNKIINSINISGNTAFNEIPLIVRTNSSLNINYKAIINTVHYGTTKNLEFGGIIYDNTYRIYYEYGTFEEFKFNSILGNDYYKLYIYTQLSEEIITQIKESSVKHNLN